MSLESRLRDLCPPILLQPLKRVLGKGARYDGGFGSWEEASARSSGYDADLILARVIAATRKVVAGEAAYERDTVLFDEPSCPFHLLMPMLKAMLQSNGALSVLDFGGSLGSTYRQCRPYLGDGPVYWTVVEQRSFVAAGKAEFETEELRFAETVQEGAAQTPPNVFLLSSSLQYLDNPDEILRQASGGSCRYLIIDRTPFADGLKDHVCVQHVPAHIYPASYPMRVFGYERVKALLAQEWERVCEYVSPEGRALASGGLPFEFRGLILGRKRQ
jgi:putative methyltransferase (TIGR04325 family)